MWSVKTFTSLFYCDNTGGQQRLYIQLLSSCSVKLMHKRCEKINSAEVAKTFRCTKDNILKTTRSKFAKYYKSQFQVYISAVTGWVIWESPETQNISSTSVILRNMKVQLSKHLQVKKKYCDSVIVGPKSHDNREEMVPLKIGNQCSGNNI